MDGYKLGASTMQGKSRSRSMGIDPNKNLMELAIDMGKAKLDVGLGSQNFNNSIAGIFDLFLFNSS